MARRRRKIIWQSKAIAIIALSTLTLSTPAFAGGSRHFDDGYYVDAEVVRVEPLVRMVKVAAPRRVCWEQRVRYARRARWRHRYPWRHHRPDPRYATVEHRCEIRTEYHNEARIDGYNVTYRYQGRHFTTGKDHPPGNRIRLRVRVEPTAEYERVSGAGKEYRSRDFICNDDCFDS